MKRFEPHKSGKLFYYRELEGKFQVCDGTLQHVCICDDEESARMVVHALNEAMKYIPDFKLKDFPCNEIPLDSATVT